MRNRLLSLGIGVLGAAGLTGMAWSVQLMGLPRPAHADVVAAGAAGWLNDYRAAVAVFRAGDRRSESLCIHGSAKGLHTIGATSSLLVLHERRFHVLQTDGGERVVHAGRDLPQGLLIANVSCTYQLLVQIGEATHRNAPVDAAPTRFAGKPAIALRLPAVRHERLTIYVDPGTYRPLAARAVIGGQQATARLHLVPFDRSLLQRFGLQPRLQ